MRREVIVAEHAGLAKVRHHVGAYSALYRGLRVSLPRALSIILLLTAGAAALFLAWAFWPYTMDDSYITLRYAENAARHGALVFNSVGPRAEGYTSLSWTLLMVLPHLLGWAAMPVAKVLGLLSLAGAAALAARLAGRIGERNGVSTASPLPWVVLIWMVTFAPTTVHAISGMETALFTLLLTGFLSELYRSVSGLEEREEASFRGARPGKARPPRSLDSTDAQVNGSTLVYWGLALGLTRPEGNAIAALGYALLFAGAPAAQRKRLALYVLFVHGLVFSGYFAWRAAYYGTLWPLPFYVKVAGVTGWPGTPSVKGFLLAAFIPLLPSLVLGTWVTVKARLRHRGLWAVAICLLFTWLAFLRAAHVMGIEHRFLYPTFPALCALAAGSLQRFWHGVTLKPALRLTVVGVCVLAPVLRFGQSFRVSYDAARGYAIGLAQAHQALAAQLAAAVEPGKSPAECRLAVGDAGVVPYLSKWTTLDTFGLNDFHIATARDHSAEYVAAFQPDVWVLLSSSSERFVPLLAWEEDALKMAQTRGYDFSRRIRFNDAYHLWVGQPLAGGNSSCRLR